MKHKVGHSLIFCTQCGSLLDPPSSAMEQIHCSLCLHSIPASGNSVQIVTSSKKGTFPEMPKANKLKKVTSEKGATVSSYLYLSLNPINYYSSTIILSELDSRKMSKMRCYRTGLPYRPASFCG